MTTAGTVRLVRLILRRDRLRLALWILGITAVTVASAASIVAVYDTPASIQQYTMLVGDNPATVAMAGPGHGFDDPNIGVVLANEGALWVIVGLALMSIFTVVRSSRAEEEAERIELIRSQPVGRHAPMASTLVVVSGANAVAAVAIVAGLVASGYELVGSIALALASAAAALVFAGAAAVCAQLVGTSRAALGLAAGVLGTAFVVRAVGDLGDGTLTWFSPVGWGQAVRSFADERWWTIGLSLVVATALVAVAVVLENHRDHGSGMLPQRAGPPTGRRWVTGPLGFALRLQRGAVLGWALGVAILGLVYGSVADDIEALMADTPEFADFLAQVGGASPVDSYFATVAMMLALVATGFALASAVRLRSEESAGRAEPLLALPLGRLQWVAGGLVVTVVGAATVLAAGGSGVWAGNAAITGETDGLGRLVGAALGHLPAVLLLVGIAVALFGVAPRLIGLVWAAMAGSIVISLFGDLLQLPHWVQMVSPFTHVAMMPAESFDGTSTAVLVTAAAALTAAGMAGFRTRDLG